MKRVFLFIFVSLMLGASSVFAQNHFTPGDFNCDANCNLIFSVTLNGDALASSDIEVAAFVGDECRQTARLGDGTENPAYGTMQIPHDGVVTVTFKMYDHNAVAEYDNCLTTITTEEDEEVLGPLEIAFTTVTTTTQTIALVGGANWFSTGIDITLNDLKAALIAAAPGTTITIKAKGAQTSYNPSNGRWSGTITWNVNQMYIITVTQACELTLEGDPVVPAEHPITIKKGANWIGYPLNQSKTLTEAFAGFAVDGDQVKSKGGSAGYNRGRWQGQTLTTLDSGKGYIFVSSEAEDRTLVFPAAE